jgi:hypothetical protein
MSVDAAFPELKEMARPNSLTFPVELQRAAELMGLDAPRFKWAYPDMRRFGEWRASFEAVLAHVLSNSLPTPIVGFILVCNKQTDLGWCRSNGFTLAACVKEDEPWFKMDLTKHPAWPHGDIEHHFPAPPHTTVSALVVLFNKRTDCFVVLDEDAFDAKANVIKRRVNGLIGGRKPRGQGIGFAGLPGGEIEIETGLTGAEYLASLQAKMTLGDDMYGGDTLLFIEVYVVDCDNVPMVASKARLNAEARWVPHDEFLEIFAKKEGDRLARRLPSLIEAALHEKAGAVVVGGGVSKFVRTEKDGRPRFTMALSE